MTLLTGGFAHLLFKLFAVPLSMNHDEYFTFKLRCLGNTEYISRSLVVCLQKSFLMDATNVSYPHLTYAWFETARGRAGKSCGYWPSIFTNHRNTILSPRPDPNPQSQSLVMNEELVIIRMFFSFITLSCMPVFTM